MTAASCIALALRLQAAALGYPVSEVGIDAARAVCANDIALQTGGVVQLTQCTVADGAVTCDWHTYGRRRLPLEPDVRL